MFCLFVNVVLFDIYFCLILFVILIRACDFVHIATTSDARIDTTDDNSGNDNEDDVACNLCLNVFNKVGSVIAVLFLVSQYVY